MFNKVLLLWSLLKKNAFSCICDFEKDNQVIKNVKINKL